MKPKGNDKKSFLTRTDINFEKWSIFTTRKQNCGRTLQRTNGDGLTQTVSISPLEKNSKHYTLTASECKLMYVLKKLWQNAGSSLEKPVLFSMKQLADELGLKWSGETLKHLKRWLMALRGVMIIFENCYKTSKDGEIIKMTEMMTILHHLKIFEKNKKDTGVPISAFSEFQFHPYILQSLHNNFVKPVRLDVICQLKSDIAVILYRWLDLMLFGQNMIEREFGNLAKELGLEHIRNNNLLNQVKHAASELEGKELVTGMIETCKVERLKDGRGWKLVVKKSKVVNAVLGDSDNYRQQAENEVQCRKYFDSLAPETQKQIMTKINQAAEQDEGYKLVHSENGRQLWKDGKLIELINQMLTNKRSTDTMPSLEEL
ncbi:MAG: RepB family plasmid replication initiator protein [Elusimicrobiota bacterium]